MSLMNACKNNMRILLYFIVFGFIVGMFAGLGSYVMSEKHNTVAIVNGEKIKRSKFDSLFSTILRNKEESESEEKITKETIEQLREKTIQTLMQETLMLQEALKTGDKISENEIRQHILKYPIFQKNEKFDPATYYKNLKYIVRKTPEQFEKMINDKILIEKAKYLIANSVKVSTNEIKFEYEVLSQHIPEEITINELAQKYITNKRNLLLNEWFKNKAEQAKIKNLLNAK